MRQTIESPALFSSEGFLFTSIMKNRMVNTRFWQDSYVSDLDPIEKLLFLYCLTNNYSTLCGIYELPLKLMSAETGIDRDMIEKIFVRFEKAGKIAYKDGWVVVKNFIKHHEQGSPKIKIGIKKDLENAPLWAKNFIFGKGIDTLSPLASTSTSTSTSIAKEGKASALRKYNVLEAQIIKAFETVDAKNKKYYGNKTQRDACNFLIEQYGLDKVLKVIEILPQTNTRPYYPKIYTPVQLRDKWQQLGDAIATKRTEKKGKGIIL